LTAGKNTNINHADAASDLLVLSKNNNKEMRNFEDKNLLSSPAPG
jgi:hypothetical protein